MCNILRKTFVSIVILLIITFSFGCGSQDISTQNDITDVEASGITESRNMDVTEMKLYINNEEVPVTWNNNSAVSELKEQASASDITVSMSMYSDNEQVGSLGRRYTTEDARTTTHNGDMVLYGGSNIVVFYGSNTWSYTRLGKINLPETEVTDLLSKNNVDLKISCE